MSRSSDATSEGVEHLQAAAKEMLAAARSFLDVVEEVVSDREAMASFATVVVDVLESAGRSLSSFGDAAHRRTATTPGAPGEPPANGATNGAANGSRVRRVVVE